MGEGHHQAPGLAVLSTAAAARRLGGASLLLLQDWEANGQISVIRRRENSLARVRTLIWEIRPEGGQRGSASLRLISGKSWGSR